jgi:mono/diheme cytochrome c family protein
VVLRQRRLPELLSVAVLDRVVHIVQIVTAVVVAAFVILLFVNEPAQPAPVPAAGTQDEGATLYSTRCASCHGEDGGGSFGPALGAGVAVGRFPDAADQIAVVSDGRGSMPAFADTLTPEQVAAVVEYTRTGLG